MSLKIVPIDRLCGIYLLHHLRNVEEYRDLEIWVRGHSRSLKMTPFDRSHTSFYSSFILTMAVSCAVFETRRVEIFIEKGQFLIPLQFNLHGQLEPS